MALEFFTPQDLPSALAQEIVAFLDSQITSHPFQFPQWADSRSRFVLLRQDYQIRWFASCGTQFPLGARFSGFRALTINRGPVCDDREVWRQGLQDLVEQSRRDGLAYVDVAPDWPQPGPQFDQDWKPLSEGRVSLRLDLLKTPDELLAGLRKNTRYEVRRAERAAVTAEPSSQASHIEDFLKLYLRLAGRKGFSADPPDHLRRILHWLIAEPSRGALLLARDRASIAGGAVIVRSGKCCWYVWGASDKRDQFSAGHWLQWQALLWARSQGCTEYDFGGYTPGATSGPAWFKEGFGGRLVHFVPAHRRVIRSRCHHLIKVLSFFR